MKWRFAGFVVTVVIVLATAIEVDRREVVSGGGGPPGTRLIVQVRDVPGWVWGIVALSILVLPFLIGMVFPEKTTDTTTAPAPDNRD